MTDDREASSASSAFPPMTFEDSDFSIVKVGIFDYERSGGISLTDDGEASSILTDDGEASSLSSTFPPLTFEDSDFYIVKLGIFDDEIAGEISRILYNR